MSALVALGVLSGSSQGPFAAQCRVERFANVEPGLRELAERLLSHDFGAFWAIGELGTRAAPIGVAVLCATEGCCQNSAPVAYQERDEWVSGTGSDAVEALVALGPSVLPDLAKLVVTTPDDSVREAFARTCEVLGERAAPATEALVRLVEEGVLLSIGRGAVAPGVSALLGIGTKPQGWMVVVTRRFLEAPGSDASFGLQHLLAYWSHAPGKNAQVVPLLTRMLAQTVSNRMLLEANAQALQLQGHLAASSVGTLQNIRNRQSPSRQRDFLDRVIASIKAATAEHEALEHPSGSPH